MEGLPCSNPYPFFMFFLALAYLLQECCKLPIAGKSCHASILQELSTHIRMQWPNRAWTANEGIRLPVPYRIGEQVAQHVNILATERLLHTNVSDCTPCRSTTAVLKSCVIRTTTFRTYNIYIRIVRLVFR